MAEIPVNREEWESLSAQDQEEVQKALKEAGAITDKDTISPSDDAPRILTAAGDPACVAACNAAYAAAVARCNLIPRPARAICFAAAMAAYVACLRNC